MNDPILTISINGTEYECTPSMGAMLRFKQETGREITEMSPTSPSDLFTYLWCCVASAANRRKKSFELSLMDFADAIMPEDFAHWAEAITGSQAEAPAAEEKKRP